MKTLTRFVIHICYYAAIVGIIYFAANNAGKAAIWSGVAAAIFGFIRVVLSTDAENDRVWRELHPRL